MAFQHWLRYCKQPNQARHLSLTPRFSGVIETEVTDRNRFNGFHRRAPGLGKTSRVHERSTCSRSQSPDEPDLATSKSDRSYGLVLMNT